MGSDGLAGDCQCAPRTSPGKTVLHVASPYAQQPLARHHQHGVMTSTPIARSNKLLGKMVREFGGKRHSMCNPGIRVLATVRVRLPKNVAKHVTPQTATHLVAQVVHENQLELTRDRALFHQPPRFWVERVEDKVSVGPLEGDAKDGHRKRRIGAHQCEVGQRLNPLC